MPLFFVNTELKSWIVDSGATDHICFSLDLFESHGKIDPVPVRTPNGNLAMAEVAENISLTDTLMLTEVVYLPMFNFDLVSISNLTKLMHYSFHFYDDTCVIQNSSKMRIGSASLRDGLYHLKLLVQVIIIEV